MPDEDKNFGGSLVLDFRKWWRHVQTIYRERVKRIHSIATRTANIVYFRAKWQNDADMDLILRNVKEIKIYVSELYFKKKLASKLTCFFLAKLRNINLRSNVS